MRVLPLMAYSNHIETKCNRLQNKFILESKKKSVNNFMYKNYSKGRYQNSVAGMVRHIT